MNDNLISLDGDRKFIGESMSLKTLKNKENERNSWKYEFIEY